MTATPTPVEPTATVAPTEALPDETVLREPPAAAEDNLYTLPYIPSWAVWGLEGALLVVALLAAFVALLVRRIR